jgi:hypothetical protein
VLGVVGQLLLVLTLTDVDFSHVARKCIADLLADLFIPAGHAALVERAVATPRAALALELLFRPGGLVQLLAVIELLQTVGD